MAGFFDGLSALNFVNGAVDIFKAKEQTKVAKVEAQTKAAEDAQRRAIEAANITRQNQIVTEKLARDALNNEQMWKLASWVTMVAALSVVGATVYRIMRRK